MYFASFYHILVIFKVSGKSVYRHYSVYNGTVNYQIKVKQVYWNLPDCVMVFKLLFMRYFNLEFIWLILFLQELFI